MILTQVTRSLVRRSQIPVSVRSISGLPKYDAAAKIGLAQLWPAVLTIAGILSSTLRRSSAGN